MKRLFLFFLIGCLFSSLLLPLYAEGDPPPVKKPEISAERAIIFNAKSGSILYGKNETEEGYCGFLPRLMTCILLAESGKDLTEEVIIPAGVDVITPQKSSAQLSDGDRISYSDLMSAILVGNSQEACYAVALLLGQGDLDAFVEQMNTRGKSLGAENTVFTEPAGYYTAGTESKTTALDAAKIAAHAMTLEHILDKSNISTANLTVNGRSRILYTRNALIDRNDLSYSSRASGLAVHGDDRIGSSMASTNSSVGARLVAVAISSKSVSDTFSDIRDLLDYAIESFQSVTLLEKNTPVAEIKVKTAKDKDTLILIAEENIDAMIPNDLEIKSIERIVDTPEELQAPVEKGVVVGTVTLRHENEVFGTVSLITQTAAELDLVESYTAKISDFFKQTTVRIIIAALLALVLIYILITFLKNRKNQKKKKITAHNRVTFRKPENK